MRVGHAVHFSSICVSSDELKRAHTCLLQTLPRLKEASVHHWLSRLKKNATKDKWELISETTFHDLCHDFALRASAAG